METFLTTINNNTKPWQKKNKIDLIMSQSMRASQKICHKHNKSLWSEKLHKASLKVRSQSIMKKTTNNTDIEPTLNKIQKTLPTLPIQIPNKANLEVEYKQVRHSLKLTRFEAVVHKFFSQELKQ